MALANTTNVLQVRVTDSNPWDAITPHLSDTKAFTVIVNPLALVILTPVALTNGWFVMQVSGPLGPDYILQASATLTNWSDLWTNTPAAMPFSLTDTNTGPFRTRFYRALLGP